MDDLVPVIGRKNRVYEILARRRPLRVRMIRALNKTFNIPVESLFNQYSPKRAAQCRVHHRAGSRHPPAPSHTTLRAVPHTAVHE